MYLFKCLAKQFADKKPFAVYRKPNSSVGIGLFQKTYTLHQVETFEENGFVLAPFYEGVKLLIPLAESAILTEQLENQLIDLPEITLNYQDREAGEAFESLVTRCIAAIEEGQFAKVVPSRKEAVPFDLVDVCALFQKIASTYPTAFCSMVYHPEVGLWVGATPESLLSLKGDKLHTMALAGTQVNHGQEEVLWGLKEQEEQQYVTDFIVETLKPFATSVVTSEPFTKRAAKVMHICTAVEASLKQTNLEPIVNALHPTPAVCGMPKTEARDYLLKEEGYNRKYYAGYLGELNCDVAAQEIEGTDLYVNLRCMEIEQGFANLYIGCGVTKDSNPQSEFIETVNKSSTMKKILH